MIHKLVFHHLFLVILYLLHSLLSHSVSLSLNSFNILLPLVEIEGLFRIELKALNYYVDSVYGQGI
jgi:hypothetical protein